MYSLGLLYHMGYNGTPNELRAFELFQRAAELGVCEAHLPLGGYFSSGGPVMVEQRKAFEHKLIAAQGGSVLAQASVGLAYWYGKGVPEDHLEAVRWYRRAVRGVSVEASMSLHQSGEFRLRRSFCWSWIKAALLRNPKSFEALAYCYATRHGVRRNPNMAREVLKLLDAFGAQELEIAVSEAVKAGAPGLGAIQQLLDQRRHAATLPPPVSQPLPEKARNLTRPAKPQPLQDWAALTPKREGGVQ